MESRLTIFFSLLLLLFGIVVFCSSNSVCYKNTSAPLSQKTTQGKIVKIEGIARNAVLGAVIVKEDGMPVYIDGLTEWPQNLIGKRVSAKGFLKEKKLAPDPVVDKHGGISHGMEGLASVLEQAQWSEVKQ